jgi:hypothetical protein
MRVPPTQFYPDLPGFERAGKMGFSGFKIELFQQASQ